VPDTPDCIQASQQYLADFSRLKESASDDRELFDGMTKLYPDWASHQAWLLFGFAPTGV
jgi:hypothetical protein